VIIDLTGIRDSSGPARLLDMVEGRSTQAFQTRLAARPQAWRDKVQVVARDGFTGFKTAAAEELPDAVTVMDPFHVVRLAGEALLLRGAPRTEVLRAAPDACCWSRPDRGPAQGGSPLTPR